uniref:Transmembrane domain-containing protein n=1 Tax=Trepomonas sp. PC1 TaxID=1076344 RepID=A0A146KHF8_9EUKA|eukprot:JAP95568.1 Transmembrane domain-containing protein [Trepomonas sp. PC1]
MQPQNPFQAPKVTESDFDLKPTINKIQATMPQTKEQNEQDMLTGPLLNELGISPKMIWLKLKTSIPFVQIPDDVASYPEMLFGVIILMLILVLNLFTKANLRQFIPLMFGSLVYGSIFFKLLINLLLQGQKSIDLYNMMSAICYSITPIMIEFLVFSFVAVSKKVFLLCCIPGVVAAAYVLQKHLSAIIEIQDQKLLVAFPAAIYSAFWVLMGSGIGK